jgi:hypothetical protein
MPVKSCIGGYDRKKLSQKLKTVRYSPRKCAAKMKNMSFGDATQIMYRLVTIARNCPGTENCVL